MPSKSAQATAAEIAQAIANSTTMKAMPGSVFQKFQKLRPRGLDNDRCPGSECAYATDMRALNQAMDQFYAALDANVR